MENEFQDRIDDYILHRMSAEEEKQFELEISLEKTKQEQFEFTRNLKTAITSREDKLVEIYKMREQYKRDNWCDEVISCATGTDDYMPMSSGEVRQYRKKTSKQMWWWMSGIVAMLVIGLFVVRPWSNDLTPLDSPSEIIRGEEDIIFDADISVIDDSIQNDTVEVNEN